MQRLVNAKNALIREPTPEECFQSVVPNYALLFFDHLHSEYLALKPGIKEPQVISLLDSLHEKRVNCDLTWSDIYTFDLALIDERPLENLIRKAFDARAKYRSIAGQKEYDEYLASKPPDLTAILIKPGALRSQPEEIVTSPPNILSPPNEAPEEETHFPGAAEIEIVQRILRADIRYLLSKFYLYYAMLPMREGLREQLTKRAFWWTVGILIVMVILALASLGGLKIFASQTFKQVFDLTSVFGITVASVACAGIVGGCVSMLQRIQSAPTEGDALFNLAALTNGWRGLSLSPLYGAIFASLLFVLFAAGILQGSAFPKIETVGSDRNQAVTTTTETAANPSASPSASPTPAPVPSATPKARVLQVKEFLRETGPRDGVSFALLMIWSFIAGFAERLVPDTLKRLVAKTEAIQGK
jgi:hypothetical protein